VVVERVAGGEEGLACGAAEAVVGVRVVGGGWGGGGRTGAGRF